MPLFNEDRDAAARTEEQERFMGFPGHDHFGTGLRGWRAERDHAMRLDQANGDDAQKARLRHRSIILQRIRDGLQKLVWNT